MDTNFADFFEGVDFRRYLADFVTAEFSRLRPSAPALALRERDDLSFAAEGVALDSLERVQLATAVVSVLQLGRSGEAERLQEKARFSDWLDECRRLLRAGGSAIGFKSSGSAGAPRVVIHELSTLAQEVEFLAKRLGSARRVVSFASAHHIYGFLFTVLLPRRLGIPVFDARAHGVASIGPLLRDDDLLVAYPTPWEDAARSEPRWPKRVAGVSSGAPCACDAAAMLRASGLRFVEVYGSTETGGVGWREDAGAFRLFEYWSKRDEETVVKGGAGAIQAFTLPDVLAWSDAETFVPLRRRDGAVQVGGVNVYPELVRSCLMAHEAVADARVRLMRPEEGVRLKAFVVPKRRDEDIAKLHAQLEAWVEQRLVAPQRPRAYAFGPKPPVAASGKPADWPIRPHNVTQ